MNYRFKINFWFILLMPLSLLFKENYGRIVFLAEARRKEEGNFIGFKKQIALEIANTF